eukprot:COSAG01_NODE_1777_length_9258_cov_7.865284_12_plen_51_part_01
MLRHNHPGGKTIGGLIIIHLTIMRNTQRTYVHVGRERFQQFSYYIHLTIMR